MSFSFSKALVYGVTMAVALAIGLTISGSWSTVVIGAASLAGGVIGALVFGFLMRDVSVDLPGATPAAIEAAVQKTWQLRSFKSVTRGEDGSVTFRRGTGILGDTFSATPIATGVTLTGPASILNVVKRKAAGR